MPDTGAAIDALERARRDRPADHRRRRGLVAVEDAARYRDALGVPLPQGIPEALLEPVRDPAGDLVLRYARSHGPFSARELAARFGLGPAVAESILRTAHRNGASRRGRVPTGRQRARVGRSRRPPQPAPPLARQAPPGDRTGRCGRARSLRGVVARHRLAAARAGGAARRDRTAAGRGGAGHRARNAGAARTRARLQPGDARHADGGR